MLTWEVLIYICVVISSVFYSIETLYYVWLNLFWFDVKVYVFKVVEVNTLLLVIRALLLIMVLL